MYVILIVHPYPYLPELGVLLRTGWVLPSRCVVGVEEAYFLQWGRCSLVHGNRMVVVGILHCMCIDSLGCYIPDALGIGAFAAKILVVEG